MNKNSKKKSNAQEEEEKAKQRRSHGCVDALAMFVVSRKPRASGHLYKSVAITARHSLKKVCANEQDRKVYMEVKDCQSMEVKDCQSRETCKGVKWIRWNFGIPS